MRTAESSVADARATNHAMSLGLALAVAACPIALWAGDLAAAEHYVEMLLDHSTRHAARRAGAPLAAAIRECSSSSAAMSTPDYGCCAPPSPNQPRPGPSARLFAFLISAASRHAGQIADGLPAIEEAIVRSERTEERWLDRRVAARQGRDSFCCGARPEPPRRPRVTSGRRSTWHAGKARCPGNCAPPRALPGCGATRPGAKQAHELLAPVYDRFTEGFATADLRAAKSLLEELS